jgi:hypothetical protein
VNRPSAYCRAANTHCWALFGTDRFTVHPVAICVMVRLKQYCPVATPASCPTRSISTNPGTASSQSARSSPGVWPARVPTSGRSSPHSSASAAPPPCPSGPVPRPAAARARAPATSVPVSCRLGPAAPPNRQPAPRSPADQHRWPRRPGTHRPQLQSLTQSPPRIIPVPARQLYQLIKDPHFLRPAPAGIGPGLDHRDGLALADHQSHPSTVRPASSRTFQ